MHFSHYRYFKDNFTKEYGVEAGEILLADCSVLVVESFDKLKNAQ
jgi:DNA replicative helicase MCM subunit Mcm2 (Cdc46/Mcm family)